MALLTAPRLERFFKVREDPYARAREEKAKGRKVIGITPMHFPEELVHASGAYPVLLQESTEPVTIGWSHIFPYFCAFARSNVDSLVNGRLDFFDGIVVSDMCLQIRTAFGIMEMKHRVPVIHHWWPLEYNRDRWLESSVARLAQTKKAIEAITGTVITDDAMRTSIALYNRNRALLREVAAIRGAKPDVISPREMDALTVSSMVEPKEEQNERLEALIPELRAAPSKVETRPRIFLSGHLCHAPNPEILDLVEEAGAVVVGDDLYAGTRYYAAEIDPAMPPMEGLVTRYFKPGVPCPTKCGPEMDWADYVVGQIAATGAQGFLSLMPKHCEPHMFYYPYLRKRLMEIGVPIVFIETEHENLQIESVRTRIQALVETVRGDAR